MVKKSKTSAKEESNVLVKEETIAVKEESTTSGKDGEGIDAVRILMAIGGFFCVIVLVFFILRYVLHVM